MKLVIKKEILLKGLHSVSKAISNKNLIPILSGIKFSLKKEGLYLNASDNDISIEVLIDTKDIEESIIYGSTVIQGKYILEIIKKLEDNNISIELLDEIKILIKSGKSEFLLNSMDPTEFPNFNIEKGLEKVFIDKHDLKELINKTSFAVSLQETRPILTGINIKTVNLEELEATATDSYRLANKKIKIKNKIKEEINVVIPGKNLVEFIRILDDKKGDIEINILRNKAIFISDNIIFQTRVLSGTFPNTSKLIPETFRLSILAKTTKLYNVIDRASLLTSEKEKNIINLENIDNYIIVSSNMPEIGKVEEKMDIIKNNEEVIKIAFSSKFILDALRIIDSPEISINFKSEIDPIIIKDPKDETLIQLILPIKTY